MYLPHHYFGAISQINRRNTSLTKHIWKVRWGAHFPRRNKQTNKQTNKQPSQIQICMWTTHSPLLLTFSSRPEGQAIKKLPARPRPGLGGLVRPPAQKPALLCYRNKDIMSVTALSMWPSLIACKLKATTIIKKQNRLLYVVIFRWVWLLLLPRWSNAIYLVGLRRVFISIFDREWS